MNAICLGCVTFLAPFILHDLVVLKIYSDEYKYKLPNAQISQFPECFLPLKSIDCFQHPIL
jgi:hypothetical protein